MEKLKELWFRVRCVFHYAGWAIKRWTGPRVYVVQYAYVDKDGNMIYDAHVVRGVRFNVRTIVAYLQQTVPGKNLRILGLNEVPAYVYNGPVIDNAEQFVKKVDSIADNFKVEEDKPEPVEEEDDGTKDATDMLG